MSLLDIQIVAAALLRFRESLPRCTCRSPQTAYLISKVIAIAVSGFLARALSMRRLFAAASPGFVVTSLACGLASDFGTPIVWRSLQGLRGGSMVPAVFATG